MKTNLNTFYPSINLASIDVHELQIPFRFRYGHSKAAHKHVKSIVCVARSSDGCEGYGEAVPRRYVTGETVESVQATILELVNRLNLVGYTWVGFQDQIRKLETEVYPDAVPACAICAIELAVADLVARQNRVSLSELIGSSVRMPVRSLEYTASIGMSSRKQLIALLLLYKSLGIRYFKVKVGDENDAERVRQIRKLLGSEVTVFADANGAWQCREQALRRIDELATCGVWAMEEPLQALRNGSQLTAGHFQDNAWVQERSPVPLIADESLVSLRNAEAIVATGAFKIFNIRLSKCGGYTRANQFADVAESAGLSYSLGAMVGESPILATAGSIWGSCHPDHLYIQGHSHRVLHGCNFVEGGARLKKGGISFPPGGAGLDLSIRSKGLKQITKQHTAIHLN